MHFLSLFTKLLKNATSQLRTAGYTYGNRYGNSSNPRSGYQKTEDIPMTGKFSTKDGYSARITTSKRKGSFGDDGSEDGILPPRIVISKQTDVVWSVQDARHQPGVSTLEVD
jgi:hypothetical protein